MTQRTMTPEEAEYHRRGIMDLKKRAARGNTEAALAILSRAPDVPPDPGDEMPAKAS